MPQSRRKFLARHELRARRRRDGESRRGRFGQPGSPRDPKVTPGPAGMLLRRSAPRRPSGRRSRRRPSPKPRSSCGIDSRRRERRRSPGAGRARWPRRSSGARARASSRSRTTLAPATLWNPMIPGVAPAPTRDRFVRSSAEPAARCRDATTTSRSRRSRAALALDRVARADVRAAHEHLPRAHRAARPEAPDRHHADAGRRARRRRSRPTPRSPRASTAARCTASPSA